MDRYSDIENLLLKMYANPKLPKDRRHSSMISIFSLPSFFKPKTKLSLALVQEISALDPENPENAKLISVTIKAFDKRSKFTFYENKLNEMPAYMEEIREFLGLAAKYFNDSGVSDEKAESLVKSELSIFFKYLILSSITLE